MNEETYQANQEPTIPNQTPMGGIINQTPSTEPVEVLSLEPESSLPPVVEQIINPSPEPVMNESELIKQVPKTNKILTIIIATLGSLIILGAIFFILVMTDNNPFTKKGTPREQGIVDSDKVLDNVKVPGPKDQ